MSLDRNTLVGLVIATIIGVIVAEPAKHYVIRAIAAFDSWFLSERSIRVNFPTWYDGDLSDLSVRIYPADEEPDFRTGEKFPGRLTSIYFTDEIPDGPFNVIASFPNRSGFMVWTIDSDSLSAGSPPNNIRLPEIEQWTQTVVTAVVSLRGRSAEGLPGQENVWMDLVKSEEKFWSRPEVTEESQEGQEKILEYFAATDFQTNEVQPWGCAFLAWVITKTSSTIDTFALPGGSVRCANWNEFGEPLNEPAIGAIANFVPFVSEAISGFGGFIVEFDDETVTVIGGNIRDSVRTARYSRDRLTSVRWPARIK